MNPIYHRKQFHENKLYLQYSNNTSSKIVTVFKFVEISAEDMMYCVLISEYLSLVDYRSKTAKIIVIDSCGINSIFPIDANVYDYFELTKDEENLILMEHI